MNRKLKNDLKDFLETYMTFTIDEDKSNDNELVVIGTINVVDNNSQLWGDYDIKIVVPKRGYPNIIPRVYEVSSKIERLNDYHISDKGECCLDIFHKLILEKRRGISLVDFYIKYIYPFFANHQYKLKTDEYANGEYDHFNKGIIQFYNDEFQLKEPKIIIKLLELAIGLKKTEANTTCPVCGNPKYKKCCRPIVFKLILFGKEQLQYDLSMFNELTISSN